MQKRALACERNGRSCLLAKQRAAKNQRYQRSIRLSVTSTSTLTSASTCMPELLLLQQARLCDATSEEIANGFDYHNIKHTFEPLLVVVVVVASELANTDLRNINIRHQRDIATGNRRRSLRRFLTLFLAPSQLTSARCDQPNDLNFKIVCLFIAYACASQQLNS